MKIQEKLENIVDFNVYYGTKVGISGLSAGAATVSLGEKLDNHAVALTGLFIFLGSAVYSVVVMGSVLYTKYRDYYHSNKQE